MNKLFKDIRHSDIEAVRASISKKADVVNEVYNAKAPKKDIGQSPLQVAIKCGEFEIIELLLENGADADFMEDPALVPRIKRQIITKRWNCRRICQKR